MGGRGGKGGRRGHQHSRRSNRGERASRASGDPAPVGSALQFRVAAEADFYEKVLEAGAFGFEGQITWHASVPLPDLAVSCYLARRYGTCGLDVGLHAVLVGKHSSTAAVQVGSCFVMVLLLEGMTEQFATALRLDQAPFPIDRQVAGCWLFLG